MEKQCSKCNILKITTDFDAVPKGQSKDGYRGVCKDCRNLDRRNRNKKKSYTPSPTLDKKYCWDCDSLKEIIDFNLNRTSKDGYHNRCKLCCSNANKKLYLAKPEQIKEKTLAYYKNNKDKVGVARRKRSAERRQTDPLYVFKRRMRHSIRTKLYNHNITTVDSINDILGISGLELKDYIESQIEPGKTIQDYDIDHVVPLSFAKNEQQVKILNYYKNLKLMSPYDNRSKGAQLPSNWQKLLKELTYEMDVKNGFPKKEDTNLKDYTFQVESYSNEHSNFIERYEWLGTAGYRTTLVYTARWNNKLAAVMLLAPPNYMNKNENIYIHRGASSSWSCDNLGTKMMSLLIKWLKKNTQYNTIRGYADPEANERGTLYKAANFKQMEGEFGGSEMYLVGTKYVGNQYFNSTSLYKKIAKKNNIQWQKEWCKPNGYKDLTKIPVEVKELVKEFKRKCPKKKIVKKLKFEYKLK